MHLEDTLRNVQTDRGRLLHGRLLRWQFDTVTLARRCRRGASTPSPQADPDADTKASDFIQCRLLAANCPRKKSPLDARWQEGASRGAPQRVRVARRELPRSLRADGLRRHPMDETSRHAATTGDLD